MNASRFKLVLGGLTLAISLVGQMALADEPTEANSKSGKTQSSEPSQADIKNSKDRGLIFNTVNVGVGAGATTTPPSIPVVTPPVPRAASAAHPSAGSKKPSHQVKTATTGKTTRVLGKTHEAQPETASASTTSAGNSGLVNVSHQTVSGDLMVKAWLNKTGNNPVYKVGEKMVINVQPSQDCNLVVFDFDGKSSLKQIFPNDYQPNGNVKGGDTINIGGPDSQFDYQVAGAGGSERIFVYAYPSESKSSPLTVAMLPASHSPFRSGEITLEQYRKLVNGSKVFFSREVKIVPKAGARPVADTTGTAPNKLELSFHVQ